MRMVNLNNMKDPVEEKLKLNNIISLVTKLPKSDRYVIYESISHLSSHVMNTKNISRIKAQRYISMITRTNQASIL